MDSKKYIGMDVHKESICAAGKIAAAKIKLSNVTRIAGLSWFLRVSVSPLPRRLSITCQDSGISFASCAPGMNGHTILLVVGMFSKIAAAAAVAEINNLANDEPNDQPQPVHRSK
jgi:hypothetical protein